MSTPARTRSRESRIEPELGSLVGVVRTVHYDVTAEDSVRRLAGRSVEFARKPDVVASARLLELCEWPCMEAIRETITPRECSLGARQQLDHRAPIAIGAHLVITARCTLACHSYSEWEVRVNDDYEQAGRATLAFVVVDRVEFEKYRVSPKSW